MNRKRSSSGSTRSTNETPSPQRNPTHFFTTSHYDNHPIVLVRLDRIDREEAVELITDSYRHRAEPSLVARLDRPGPG